jgi:acyl-CoA thioester hydrolase
VVFNSRYGEYVDVAITEFIRAIGFGAEAASGELEYQLVKQTFEWKAPARFDQVIELTVEAKALGTTSFTMMTTFRVAGEEAVLATVETVYVAVEQHTLRKIPLPGPFRAGLVAGAPGRVADFAAHFNAR